MPKITECDNWSWLQVLVNEKNVKLYTAEYAVSLISVKGRVALRLV